MGNKFKLTTPCTVENWYTALMGLELHLFKAYIDEQEIGISNSQIDAEKNVTYEVEDHGEYGHTLKPVYRDFDADTFNITSVFGEYFPSLARRANFIILMSLMERKLYELSKKLRSKLSLSKDIDEFFYETKEKGKLAKIKQYLQEVIDLRFEEETMKLWEELEILYRIRNNIVHNFGRLERGNRGILQYVSKNEKIISIDPINDEITMNHMFVSEVIATLDNFSKSMQEDIRSCLRRCDKIK